MKKVMKPLRENIKARYGVGGVCGREQFFVKCKAS